MPFIAETLVVLGIMFLAFCCGRVYKTIAVAKSRAFDSLKVTHYKGDRNKCKSPIASRAAKRRARSRSF